MPEGVGGQSMSAAIYCRVGRSENLEKNMMDQKIKEQILAIRETGLTNMFDIHTVQRIAGEMEFWELVIFLEEHKEEYVQFILTGE